MGWYASTAVDGQGRPGISHGDAATGDLRCAVWGCLAVLPLVGKDCRR